MTATALAQMLIFAAVLVAAAYPLGAWMARVYSARRAGTLALFLGPLAEGL